MLKHFKRFKVQKIRSAFKSLVIKRRRFTTATVVKMLRE